MVVTAIAAAILWSPTLGSPEVRSAPPANVQVNDSAAAAAPGPQTVEGQLAPDASGWPSYLGLAIALAVGGATCLFRLATKFSRFWLLGVTANRYAAIYVVMGMVLSGVSYFAGSQAGRLPFIKSYGPWVGSISALAALLFGPGFSFGSRAHPVGTSELVGLKVDFSRSPFFFIVEEKVLESIQNRMQEEVIAISKLYGWMEIKSAARKALGEEGTARQITDEVFENLTKFIKSLPSKAKKGADEDEKYNALYRILGQCKFRRLRRFLEASTKGRVHES
jgi:hypothetical protein